MSFVEAIMTKERDSGLHKKHKERLRDKFLKSTDFKGFSDHEILELLLNFSIIRGDTNELAHRLINEYGNLANVLSADADDLVKVEGLGERSVTFLKMQYSLLRYYLQEKFTLKDELYDKSKMDDMLKGLFFGLNQEALYMICIDHKNIICKVAKIGQGIASANVDMREIFRVALNVNARSVIFAHNHPNGVAKPSQEDFECTRFLKNQLDLIDIQLLDHFIVTDSRCISIMESHSFRMIKYSKE